MSDHTINVTDMPKMQIKDPLEVRVENLEHQLAETMEALSKTMQLALNNKKTLDRILEAMDRITEAMKEKRK